MSEGLGIIFSLGAGRSIRPPEGWNAEGFVNGDDSLRLRPASIVRWTPPDQPRLSISWSKSKVMLDPATRNHLDDLLREPFGLMSIDRIAKLFPQLLRIPIFRVTSAAVTAFPGSGPLLQVDYFIAEARQSGMIFYAPSERFAAGEVQILCYEGSEPGFSKYRGVAVRSLATFTTVPTAGVVDRKTGVVKTTRNRSATRRSGVVVRKAGTNDGPLTFEYFLKEGESIRSIVKSRFPLLNSEEQTAKAKEIYSLNRARGNELFAWSLKAGDKVWLPFE